MLGTEMEMKMKLHWSPKSPYVRKVMIALEELGAQSDLTLIRSVAANGTPSAITQKMREALTITLNTPSVKNQIAAQGAIATVTTPDEYKKLMQQESAKWALVLKKGQITLE